MAYIDPNYKTKKALREAIAQGKNVSVFSPSLFPVNQNGMVTIEGPHGYHKWYAQVIVKNGMVTKVKR